jgi:hypothetical protein
LKKLQVLNILSNRCHLFGLYFEALHHSLSDALPPVLLPNDQPETKDVLWPIQ